MSGVLDRLDGAESWQIYALVVLLAALVWGGRAVRWFLQATHLNESLGGYFAQNYDAIKSYFGAKRSALFRDWLSAGLCYERLGQFDDALDCYEKAREYHLCGELCHRMGRPDIAGEWFLVAGETQRAAAMFEEGQELEKAAEIYEKEKEPLKAADLYLEAGRLARAGALYEERGHLVKAAGAFEEAGQFRRAAENLEKYLSGIERLPDQYQTATQRATISRLSLDAARLYQEVGDLESAARILERNGQWLPAAELLEILGHYRRSAELYRRLGQTPKAARLFDRVGDRQAAAALEAESQLTEGDALSAAESFLKAGDRHRAAQLFESAGDYFGAAECYVAMEAHSLAGDALLRGGDLDQAVSYFERAGEYGRAGEIQAQLGHFEQATTLFAQAGRHYEAALAASDGGDEDAMMEHLQRVEPEDRHFNEALVTLAQLFCRRGWGSLALKRLIPVLEGEPVRREDLEVWDALAVTYETLGEYEKAIEVLQKIMIVQFNYRGVDKRCERLEAMAREERDRQSSIQQQSELAEEPPPRADEGLEGERYLIEAMLGKGGLGTVHKVYDRLLRRRIAMKILYPEVLPDQAGLMQVLGEARAAASLNHPNIVTVFDVGLRGGQPFIAMELVEGESAAAALLRRGSFEVSELMQYLVQICQGLAYAHDRGIVHQDVKPSNILMTVDKRVKLVDFGLAQPFSISALAKRRYRTATSISGTASYIAPERARGEAIDPRSDIYSLGSSLYELLSGHPPLTLGDVIKYHFKKAIPSLKSRRPDLPDALDELVKRCLLTDRAARFQSVRELVSFATESQLLPAAPLRATVTSN